MGTRTRLTLLSRQDCCLCSEMRTVVDEVLETESAEFETVDVDTDPDLSERFGEEVPVLLINGRKAFKYRVTKALLRRRLRSERWRTALLAWRRSK